MAGDGGSITEALLLRLTGAYDLELVKRLDLSGRGLKSLRGIALCPNLTELAVADNDLTDLTEVAKLGKIERLDASGNRVRRLLGLERLQHLNYLRLERNAIKSMDEIKSLSNNEALRSLYLQDKSRSVNENDVSGRNSTEAVSGQEENSGNPICNHPSYTTTVLRFLPNLTVLDGERLKLKRSSQDALLSSIEPPKEMLKIPPKTRWCEGFDWNYEDGGEPFASENINSSVLKNAAEEEAGFEAVLREAEILDREAQGLLKC